MIYEFLSKKGVFDSKTGGNALDLGCGTGEDLLEFAKAGFYVTGVEKNSESLQILKEKLDKNNLNAEITNSDIQYFEFEENYYDVVLAKNSLPFIKDTEEQISILRKIFSSMKVKAVFFVTFFGPKDAWAGKTIGTFTFDEIKKELENIGFSIKWFSTEEGIGKTMKGDMKYWHIHKFLCLK